jgi:cell division septation protein DedD
MRYILRFITLVIVFIVGILTGGFYFGGKDQVISKTKELIVRDHTDGEKTWMVVKKPKSVAVAPKPAVKPAVISKTPPKPPKKGQIYTVQVASFKDLNQARKYVNQLHEKDYDAYIAPVDIANKRGFYRVCIGESLSRDAVLMNLANLKSVFKGSFVQAF